MVINITDSAISCGKIDYKIHENRSATRNAITHVAKSDLKKIIVLVIAAITAVALTALGIPTVFIASLGPIGSFATVTAIGFLAYKILL